MLHNAVLFAAAHILASSLQLLAFCLFFIHLFFYFIFLGSGGRAGGQARFFVRIVGFLAAH